MTNIKRIVYMALLISIALALHYVEGLFPSLIPGAKLGLANIVTMVTLYLFGFKEALVIVFIRSTLGSIFAGSPTSLLYSLSGGTLSCIVMAVLYLKFEKYFSLMGTSVAGAVFHNIGQLIVASILFESFGIMLTYLPLMMLSSIITGNFVGLVSKYMIKFLSNNAATEKL